MNNFQNTITKLTTEEQNHLLTFLITNITNEFEYPEKEIKECFKCHSTKIVKLGKYNGMQRYRCKECSTSFTAKSASLFATTKLEKEKWLKYAKCFVCGYSLRKCMEEVGICLKTSYFMRQRIIEFLKTNSFKFTS